MSYIECLNNLITENNLSNEIKDLKFRDEVVGHHNGQTDFILYAILNNKAVGTTEYVEFNKIPSISMIKVQPSYRRLGIAKNMVRYIQSQYPQKEIEWGMTTPEGTALYQSIKDELYVDKEKILLKKKYEDLVLERDKLKKAMDDLYKKFDTNPDKIRNKIKELNDRFVVVDDEIYELEKEI